MPYNMKPDLGIYKESIFPYLPEELIEFIKIISPDPEAWFVGQFTSYLLRPKNNNVLGVFICTIHIRIMEPSMNDITHLGGGGSAKGDVIP